jgi:hypothetical protein
MNIIQGTVAKGKDSNSYTITGKWDLDDTRTTLIIFELPVGVWYTRFEEGLQILKGANLIRVGFLFAIFIVDKIL